MLRHILIGMVLLGMMGVGVSWGQDAIEDLMSMDLEELLNLEITVATGAKSLTPRESPGIVSVITEEEIRSSGARDLIDILYRVPGFAFGTDVEGVENVGFRGNWAHEGKMLLLLDGLENNELSYNTLILGNHYPVDHIKRIEIIRGPGSSIYGGNAELGVINIITKSAEDLNGVAVSAIYGQLEDTFRRRNISLSAGKKMGELGLTLHTFFGQGNKSDRDYTDGAGNSYNMKENADQNPLMVNLGLNYRGLSVRGMMDRQSTTQRNIFGANIPPAADPLPTHFHSYHGAIKYAWQLNEKLTITPALRFRRHYAYHALDEDVAKIMALDAENAALFIYERYTQRITEEVTASYDFNSNLNVLGGVQSYQESAHAGEDDRSNFAGPDFDYSKKEISFSDVSAFAQMLMKTSLVNITAGGRYDSHSEGSSAFVPRLGLTRVFSDLYHVKLLASQAFRTPSLINVDLNADIKSEKTTVFELESGIKINANMFLTANLFDITLKDAIIYGVDDNGEFYANREKTGSRGVEFEFRFQTGMNSQVFSYSYYSSENKNKIEDYMVPRLEGEEGFMDDLVLAFPKHKFTLSSTYQLSSQFTFNTNLIYQSKTYGYASGTVQEFNFTLLDAYLRWHHFGVKGLELGVGCYNIFNVDYFFIQPYNGGHNPIPGMGREWLVRLSWSPTK